MSESTANKQYRRVCITGVIQLKSDLHTGTGAMMDYQRNTPSGRPETFRYNCIALDQTGKPYIPGSSLRGLLSALAKASGEYSAKWFGVARGDRADHGNMGTMRVYDAGLVGKSEQSLLSHTAIDPITATAQQHQLATHQQVKAGAQFAAEIVLDTRPVGGATLIQEDEVQVLLATLSRLGGAQLGGGKSIGQGELVWLEDKLVLQTLDDKCFCHWLQNSLKYGKPTASKKKGKKKDKKKLPQKLNNLQKLTYASVLVADLTSQQQPESVSEWHTEHVTLHSVPHSPILINNPHDPEIEKKLNPETLPEDKKMLPDLVFLKGLGNSASRAIIPGSTLKGWFRARCRRILMTWVQNDIGHVSNKAASKVNFVLDELFGGAETGQSLLRFYDATLTYTARDVHTQTFNAVDRFTGGVKASALYKVKALRTDKLFSGRIAYYKPAFKLPENGWMNLLLLYVWRDAEDGDLVLGWGKSRGYGQLYMTPTDCGWQGWLEKVSPDELSRWEQNLWHKLGVKQEAPI